MPTRRPDLVRLALAFLAAEEAELALRLRLLRCARDRDHVLRSALEIVHAGAVERRDRAAEKLRALRVALGEVHAPAVAILIALLNWPDPTDALAVAS